MPSSAPSWWATRSFFFLPAAHRIGQSRKVVACRLIARATVEQKVLELQERKRELAASLFADGGGASVRDLTREDLESLFA
jgi:SNF2 family DNA or RNA helicase